MERHWFTRRTNNFLIIRRKARFYTCGHISIRKCLVLSADWVTGTQEQREPQKINTVLLIQDNLLRGRVKRTDVPDEERKTKGDKYKKT